MLFRLCLLFAAGDELTRGQPANAIVVPGDELTYAQLHDTCAEWWANGLRIVDDLESAAHGQAPFVGPMATLEHTGEWMNEAAVMAEVVWRVRPALLLAWWEDLPVELRAAFRSRMPEPGAWIVDVSAEPQPAASAFHRAV